MSTPLVVIDGVTRIHGSGPTAVTALDNVSLTIEAGELALPHAAPPGRLLPLSIYARWSAP